MAARTMESMPTEILLHIGRYLADSHSPSLLAFALANKWCFSVAIPFLFRTIKFELCTHDGLARDVQECQKLLERNASFQHVRRLIVDVDAGRDHDGDSKPPSNPDRRWRRPKMTVAEEYGEPTAAEAKTSFLSYDEKFTCDWSEDSAESLARLVQRLSLLSDFVYGTPSKFPPCLLQTLHEYRPQCRLRINRFRLRSLDAPVMDPEEFMLVSSPCLHAIKIGYGCSDFVTSDLRPDYHLEAAMSIVAGQARNLKEVGTWREFCPVGVLPRLSLWKGFVVDEGMKHKMNRFAMGSLQQLHLGRPVLYPQQCLERWKLHTDFSVLRVLRLDSAVDLGTLGFLASCNLPNLVYLSLTLVDNPTSECYNTLARFLCSLASQLSTLVLSNWLTQYEPDVTIFGPNLRKLCLGSRGRSLQLQEIEHLAERCPLLDVLSLYIPRTKGNTDEAAFYRVLGRFGRLQNLTLFLNTTTPSVPDGQWEPSKYGNPDSQLHSSFDEPEQQSDPWSDDPYASGRVRDLLVNFAVDEGLARAIFQIISSAKHRHVDLNRHCVPVLPLMSLKICPILKCSSHSFILEGHVVQYIRKMYRRWLVERSLLDGSAHILLVTKLNPIPPMDFWVPLSEEAIVEQTFRRLWPATIGDDHMHSWENDWRSWPIADDDETGI